jgi:tetratricopeptide (TPR) repeat protein
LAAPVRLAILSGLVLAIVSCATERRIVRRDDFPLDPREELTGPFPPAVEEATRALLGGQNDEALRGFAAARSGEHRIAAEIGWIEATVAAGRARDALATCKETLSAGEPTLPLLVACGEARARAGDEVAGYELYARALASHPRRRGIEQRSRELQKAAARSLMVRAMSESSEKRWKEARRTIGRAIELAPDSAPLRAAAAEIETAAGDRNRALQRYREALERDPDDRALREKVASVALESSEYGLAASLFDELASVDPRYRARSEEARLAFRVANWPAAEREAARSERITRAGAASLVWWMFPEVREARVSSSLIASDVVGRRDGRALARAVGLGLLNIDRGTHRAHPDGVLTLPAASRLGVRLLALLKPSGDEPCEGVRHPPRGTAEIIRVAQECELFAKEEASPVSGPAFTRALDRVRALVSATGVGE